VAVRELAKLGARTAVIKLGAEGAIGRRGSELVRMPAATATPVDPTGCGDAFCGGFLVGLAETGTSTRHGPRHGRTAGSSPGDHGASPRAGDRNRDVCERAPSPHW
jgi:sugar/nucleoside kinase (ribokinase family)